MIQLNRAVQSGALLFAWMLLSASSVAAPPPVVPPVAAVPAVPTQAQAKAFVFEDQLIPKVTVESIPGFVIEKWMIGEAQKKEDPEMGVRCRMAFELNAHFKAQPGDVFTWNKGRKVPLERGGGFTLKFLLTKAETQLEWQLKQSSGKVFHQVSKIQVAKWDSECIAVGVKDPSAPGKALADGPGRAYRRFFEVGVGLSWVGVQDNIYRPVQMLAVTPKISFFVPFKKPRWELGANAFINAASLYRSDVAFGFFGANGRFGIIFPWNQTAWKFKVSLGWYYLTMLVGGNAFGFQGVTGPSVTPGFFYVFKKERTLGTYFKFSLISSGLGFFSVASREFAGGISYSMPAKWGKRPVLGVSLDFSSVNLVISTRVVNSQSLTLSANLRL